MSVIFRFADFELDGRSSELHKRGRRLRVQQQPLQILAILVAAPGDVVTRDELRERIHRDAAETRLPVRRGRHAAGLSPAN